MYRRRILLLSLIGFSLNLVQADEFTEQSAKQGDADSQYKLGVMYRRGGKSFLWFAEAAMQGHVKARSELEENMYSYGKYDRTIGFWLTGVAMQGDSWAQYMSGQMHAEGIGLYKDVIRAYAWLTLATAKDVKYTVAKHTVAASMKPYQITEANKLSKELAKQIEQNNKRASEQRDPSCPDEFKKT